MREYLLIDGERPLSGEVEVSGAKNSALPLLMASLLTGGECVFRNTPNLQDIAVTLNLLAELGGKVSYEDHVARVRVENVRTSEAPHGLVKAMRASFWILGPLLARTGSARVALPGGDAIGMRPVDLHLRGLARLGADIRMQHGVVVATAPAGLHAGTITLDFPSVGATHCLLMTAALIQGETILHGAAQEPEVVELAAFLSKMGAEIEGAGSPTIKIRGQKELGGAECTVIGDRIEAVTYLVAGAITGGSVLVRGITRNFLGAVSDVLDQFGSGVEESPAGLRLRPISRIHATSFQTAPFPGVATDVQPILMAALTRAEGTAEVTENVFENRFGHAFEYRRFGANIDISGRIATIRGVETLHGAVTEAGDIRAAAGLVLMGLMARGKTEVYEVHHLDRGYEDMIQRFRKLGAEITRVPAFDGKELVMGC